jgi:translation initiation factor IF-2
MRAARWRPCLATHRVQLCAAAAPAAAAGRAGRRGWGGGCKGPGGRFCGARGAGPRRGAQAHAARPGPGGGEGAAAEGQGTDGARAGAGAPRGVAACRGLGARRSGAWRAVRSGCVCVAGGGGGWTVEEGGPRRAGAARACECLCPARGDTLAGPGGAARPRAARRGRGGDAKGGARRGAGRRGASAAPGRRGAAWRRGRGRGRGPVGPRLGAVLGKGRRVECSERA